MSTFLSISASPQQISSTHSLLTHVNRRILGARHTVGTLQVRDLPAQALLAADVHDPEIAAAVSAVRTADAIVVATPVYQAAYSGLLKVFLDLLPQFAFRGKAVLPIVTGGSPAHVLAVDYALRPVLANLGAAHIGQGWFVPSSHIRVFADGGVVIEPASLAPLADVAASSAGSPAELAAACDLVGLCVFNDDDVREVALAGGLLAAMPPGSILAIHSTVHPDTCQEIAAAAPRGVEVLDAPVSGSGEAALQRRLAVMVGGDAAAFEAARPVFETFGAPVRRMGPLGTGQLCKLVNNILLTANLKLAADAMSFGRGLGIEHAALHEMLMSIPVLEANIGHSHRQHASLVTAVERGRPDRARRVMEEHCDDTAALLRGLLG